MTRARPKIGDYSFTTLHPHVGIVEYEDFTQLSIADLPGLLPDLTLGFGTKFLYHLERCKILLYVIDISKENSFEQYLDMKNILESFNKDLLKKPSIIIANKIDLIKNDEEPDILRSRLDYLRKNSNELVAPISTLDKINLSKFLKIFRDLHDKIEINKKSD